jgi:hypothetical protein
MPLRITKSSEPIRVERLNLVVYGPPGLGKTSLAFTAAEPLLLDFDNGSHRAANRKDVVRVSSWNDVAGIAIEDIAPYQTVILDTAGRALDTLTADIIKLNPKHGRGGALTLQGYGELKARFTAFLKLLNGMGKDVVLIAHMDEQRSGDDIIERLDVQGGSKGEIYKAADAMGRLVIRNGQRQLLFSPSDAAFGKNPGQLEPLDVPSVDRPEFATFLGTVIERIKTRLNAMTEEQLEETKEQDWFRTIVPTLKDADDVNAVLPRALVAGTVCKSLLNERAKALGLRFDKATGEFIGEAKAA